MHLTPTGCQLQLNEIATEPYQRFLALKRPVADWCSAELVFVSLTNEISNRLGATAARFPTPNASIQLVIVQQTTTISSKWGQLIDFFYLHTAFSWY